MSFHLKPLYVKTSENDVREACLQLLRLRGWWPIRQMVGRFQTRDGRYIKIGEPGDPDYVVTRAPGFFLETKAPDGELSDEQKKRISHLKILSNMDTIVVADVAELQHWLDRREKSP